MSSSNRIQLVENPSVVEYWLTAVWCWSLGKKVSLGFRSRKKLGEGAVQENCRAGKVEK